MDEGFAIALNDVDLCLRAGQAGWRIIYCAEIGTVYHYKSLSSAATMAAAAPRWNRSRFAGCATAGPT